MEVHHGIKTGSKPGMRSFGHKISRTVKEETDLGEKYNYSVSFYEDPPDFTISLFDFEKLAIERLKCKYLANSAFAVWPVRFGTA